MSWISCDAKLPFKHKDVLVYDAYSSLFSVAYFSIICGWCYSETDELIDFEPTHWQPLPEPPSDD